MRGSNLGSLLLMVQKSGGHQLRLVVYPIIYRIVYIPGGAGFLPSTVLSTVPLFRDQQVVPGLSKVNTLEDGTPPEDSHGT